MCLTRALVGGNGVVADVFVDAARPHVGTFSALRALGDDEGIELVIVGDIDVNEEVLAAPGKRAGAARLKWVVVVDRTLSPGPAVSAAACVSATTARSVTGLLGPGGPDAVGSWHPGLPWAGCSILAATAAVIVALRRASTTTSTWPHW